MCTKAEKERQKQIQEKCQTLLTQMLRDEDNKYCVDCDAKGRPMFIVAKDFILYFSILILLATFYIYILLYRFSLLFLLIL